MAQANRDMIEDLALTIRIQMICAKKSIDVLASIQQTDKEEDEADPCMEALKNLSAVLIKTQSDFKVISTRNCFSTYFKAKADAGKIQDDTVKVEKAFRLIETVTNLMRAALTSVEMKKFENEQKALNDIVENEGAKNFIKAYNVDKTCDLKTFTNYMISYLKDSGIQFNQASLNVVLCDWIDKDHSGTID